jgi:predicted TIM-barrel fold metal-dependent hydrolase
MKRPTPFGELEILDAHTHFFSRKFFDTLISQSPQLSSTADPIKQASQITGWVIPPVDPKEFAAVWKDEFDRHQLSAALMMASVPNDEESIAAAVTAFPERIVGSFMFDPTKANVEARAKRALDELGLRVICLFPAMQHYSVAENEGAREIVALAGERPGTAVFIHCGALSVGARKKLGLPSRFDMRYSNPMDIYKLAAEFPQTRFIVPHFGAGMFREAMMLADLCPNIYIDTSSSNNWIKYESAPVDLTSIFKRALAVVGHERLLFGTDSSFFPRGWNAQIFEIQANILAEIGISGEQAISIFGGNLRRLLNL